MPKPATVAGFAISVIPLGLMSNQFIADLEKLASLDRDYSIDNHREMQIVERGLNTKYSTVQQIEMDSKGKEKKKGMSR